MKVVQSSLFAPARKGTFGGTKEALDKFEDGMKLEVYSTNDAEYYERRRSYLI
jgi:hypothetical protein